MLNVTRVFRYGVLPAVLLAAAATTGAQGRLNGPGTLKLEDIPWPSASAGGAGTSGASGIETVVLKGDPTKPGLYVLALRHLGAALGVRVTAVFGPTDERLTRPAGDGHIVLTHQVWCRPCMMRECPIDHRCMRGVGVDRVVGAVRQML